MWPVQRSSRQFENLAQLRRADDSHSHSGVCTVTVVSSTTVRGMISGCRNTSLTRRCLGRLEARASPHFFLWSCWLTEDGDDPVAATTEPPFQVFGQPIVSRRDAAHHLLCRGARHFVSVRADLLRH